MFCALAGPGAYKSCVVQRPQPQRARRVAAVTLSPHTAASGYNQTYTIAESLRSRQACIEMPRGRPDVVPLQLASRFRLAYELSGTAEPLHQIIRFFCRATPGAAVGMPGVSDSAPQRRLGLAGTATPFAFGDTAMTRSCWSGPHWWHRRPTICRTWSPEAGGAACYQRRRTQYVSRLAVAGASRHDRPRRPCRRIGVQYRLAADGLVRQSCSLRISPMIVGAVLRAD